MPLSLNFHGEHHIVMSMRPRWFQCCRALHLATWRCICTPDSVQHRRLHRCLYPPCTQPPQTAIPYLDVVAGQRGVHPHQDSKVEHKPIPDASLEKATSKRVFSQSRCKPFASRTEFIFLPANPKRTRRSVRCSAVLAQRGCHGPGVDHL